MESGFVRLVFILFGMRRWPVDGATWMYLVAFAAGSVGGASYVLRDDVPLLCRQTLAEVLRAGCTGLLSSLILHPWFPQAALLGVALLLGMAGETGYQTVLRLGRTFVRSWVRFQFDPEGCWDRDRGYRPRRERDYRVDHEDDGSEYEVWP